MLSGENKYAMPEISRRSDKNSCYRNISSYEISSSAEMPLKNFLPARHEFANKYDFGSLLIIAGSCGMTGAAILAARAALRAGAGLVTIACPHSERPIIAAALPEAMTLGLSEECGAIAPSAAAEIMEFAKKRKISAILIGPGLSCSKNIAVLVKNILENTCLPIAADADALNAISMLGGFRKISFPKKALPMIITPHEGEAARLLGKKIKKQKINRQNIENCQTRKKGSFESETENYCCNKEISREQASMELAEICGGIVMLKGPGTLICHKSYDAKENGIFKIFRNDTGSSELAKGGSGDVLAGITAAIYMQNGIANGFTHKTACNSAVLAAWIHGKCGFYASAALNARSIIATDLIEAIPQAFNAAENL